MSTESPRVPPANALFDTLLRKGNFKNDAALARAIGINNSAISKVRHGKAPVTDEMRCKIIRNIQITIEQVDRLAPPAESEK